MGHSVPNERVLEQLTGGEYRIEVFPMIKFHRKTILLTFFNLVTISCSRTGVLFLFILYVIKAGSQLIL